MSEEFVVPGEFLATEEEFSSGKNTFEDAEGNVYSCKTGKTEFNQDEREVSVKEKNPLNEVMEIGSIIVGQAVLIKDSFVLLEICSVEKNGKKQISLFSSAKLMVSNVSRFHVKSIKDEFKIGDYVKAKVISITKYGVDVTTAYPELGVIKAFCSKCRQPLGLFDKTLKCSNCGSVERRTLSSEFK